MTNTISFKLKERVYLSTKAFVPNQEQEPGKTYVITADPIGSLLSSKYASTLAVTLSRFREFRYFGTRMALRPAATVGQIDPAHISDSIQGSNYMHPRDVSNSIHFRRWIGGNFDLPHVNPHVSEEQPGTYEWHQDDAYNLDLAWLSDSRFNHVNVSQGFDLFSSPKRAVLTGPAAASNSMFAYASSYSAVGAGTFLDYRSHPTQEVWMPRGMSMVTGQEIVDDTWTPNPLSCFKYRLEYNDPQNTPAPDLYTIEAVNTDAPWFADISNVGEFSGDVTDAFQMIKDRYRAPICILRIPPSYGSKFYWACYFVHYFAVRYPFISNSKWTATKIQTLQEQLDAGVNCIRAVDAEEKVYQATCPDPISAAETGHVLDFTLMDGDMAHPFAPIYRFKESLSIDGMDEMKDIIQEFNLLRKSEHPDSGTFGAEGAKSYTAEGGEPPTGAAAAGGKDRKDYPEDEKKDDIIVA